MEASSGGMWWSFFHNFKLVEVSIEWMNILRSLKLVSRVNNKPFYWFNGIVTFFKQSERERERSILLTLHLQHPAPSPVKKIAISASWRNGLYIFSGLQKGSKGGIITGEPIPDPLWSVWRSHSTSIHIMLAIRDLSYWAVTGVFSTALGEKLSGFHGFTIQIIIITSTFFLFPHN